MNIRTGFGLFFALLLIASLFGCASNVPKGAITVSELFGSIANPDMNTLKVIEYYTDYLVVELNGNRYAVIPDSTPGGNIAFIGNFGFNDTPNFLTQDLFDLKTWDFDKEADPTLEYYVFLNGPDTMDFRSSKPDQVTELVLLHKNGMPKLVDGYRWNDTQATLVFWEYPMMYPEFQIVQNMGTNEIAFVAMAKAVDKNDIRYIHTEGAVWGYVYVLDGDPSGFKLPYLYIKELPGLQ